MAIDVWLALVLFREHDITSCWWITEFSVVHSCSVIYLYSFKKNCNFPECVIYIWLLFENRSQLFYKFLSDEKYGTFPSLLSSIHRTSQYTQFLRASYLNGRQKVPIGIRYLTDYLNMKTLLKLSEGSRKMLLLLTTMKDKIFCGLFLILGTTKSLMSNEFV